MTMTIDTLKKRFDVEAIPDYAGISQRFQAGFAEFVASKKDQGIRTLLRHEIQSQALAESPNFIQAVARCLDEEAILEKRYIFLSVNTELPE